MVARPPSCVTRGVAAQRGEPLVHELLAAQLGRDHLRDEPPIGRAEVVGERAALDICPAGPRTTVFSC
jgi:hypothetical protein